MTSYRDKLKEHDPDRVNSIATGGAFGCPGEYFFGAPGYERSRCFPIKEKRCRRCWGRPYAQERCIPVDSE